MGTLGFGLRHVRSGWGPKTFGGSGLPRDHEILKRIFPVTRWAPAMRDTANRTVGE